MVKVCTFIPLLKFFTPSKYCILYDPIENTANQDKGKALHFRRYYTQPYVALNMLARNKIVIMQRSLVVYTMEYLTLYIAFSLFTHLALRKCK